MNLLNVGCGSHVHPECVNLDIAALVPGVMVWDLRRGLPFDDESFDAVYHSHVLEHFDRAGGRDLLVECRRILKPGGWMRVVVPDLENVARLYLSTLPGPGDGESQTAARHEWAVLELFDQMSRVQGGGDMLDFIRQHRELRSFILERCGHEIMELAAPAHSAPGPRPRGVSHVLRCCWGLARHPARLREALIKRLLGDEYAALEVARFRQCGEVHRWMYDRVTLGALLESCGYTSVGVVDHDRSAIPGWERYCLDADAGGAPRKPQSIYFEGRR